MRNTILKTLREIVALSSTSKNEQLIVNYVTNRLRSYRINVHRDKKGNVIGYVSGVGEPILLNAHLDRVPPGKGHTPMVIGDVMKSDGSTNLGADDAAGITIILEALEVIIQEKISHPPLIIAFTVEEEIGLFGAKALDISQYNVTQGIVFDNAFEAGVVVSAGAAYVAINIEITGKAAHPGKGNGKEGISVLDIFRYAQYESGITDKGETRINIGDIRTEGGARNKVPDKLYALAEIRSFLEKQKLAKTVKRFQKAFEASAKKCKGKVNFSINQLAVPYSVDTTETLVQTYKNVVEKSGGLFKTKKTFVASDGNAFRGERGLKVFVVSTGVTNDHTLEESVNVKEIDALIKDLVTLLDCSILKYLPGGEKLTG